MLEVELQYKSLIDNTRVLLQMHMLEPKSHQIVNRLPPGDNNYYLQGSITA